MMVHTTTPEPPTAAWSLRCPVCERVIRGPDMDRRIIKAGRAWPKCCGVEMGLIREGVDSRAAN